MVALSIFVVLNTFLMNLSEDAGNWRFSARSAPHDGNSMKMLLLGSDSHGRRGHAVGLARWLGRRCFPLEAMAH